MQNGKVLTLETVNKRIINFEYSVRGIQAIRADELREQIRNDPTSVPFKSVISCNIGNPQQLGQQPSTFYRQVVALTEYPPLMNADNLPSTSKIFPADTIERAQEILDAVGGSVGSYSHSQGIPLVRKRVAEFIERRDGYPAKPNDIFLTGGASPAVQVVLNAIIGHDNVGIMIPIPQYPLYTASIALYGGHAVPYYLDESHDWSTSTEELESAIARGSNLDVRALCVINPGNPTGQCLSIDSMKTIIDFCHRKKLVLMADEVYQANIYTRELPFHSFKKVLCSMGAEYESVELISFHSISKGMIGECGRRGGYFECVNICPDVIALFYKVASVSLCPPIQGQVMMELLVNPPKKGDPSYELFKKEQDDIFDSLKRRATKLAAAFNRLEGVVCNEAQGALYLFPSIKFSANTVKAAAEAKQAPDQFYSMALLNATGVCIVPGSGFGQKVDSWHFRSTFLPSEEKMDEFIEKIDYFHRDFCAKYK